jgi:RNA polymerase sigma-70 factor (ECF subfamily)
VFSAIETVNFTATYELYQKDIYRYCVSKSRDPDTAQDLMQDTFLRFFLCVHRGVNILNTRAFLYQIARNLFIDHQRKKRECSLDVLQDAGFEPAIDPWRHLYSQMEVRRLFTALRSEQSPYAEVLHQRFMLGMPPAQIAAMTKETSNTISVRLFRGLGHLRAIARSNA